MHSNAYYNTIGWTLTHHKSIQINSHQYNSIQSVQLCTNQVDVHDLLGFLTTLSSAGLRWWTALVSTHWALPDIERRVRIWAQWNEMKLRNFLKYVETKNMLATNAIYEVSSKYRFLWGGTFMILCTCQMGKKAFTSLTCPGLITKSLSTRKRTHRCKRSWCSPGDASVSHQFEQ